MDCKVWRFYSASHHPIETGFLQKLLIKPLGNNHGVLMFACLDIQVMI